MTNHVSAQDVVPYAWIAIIDAADVEVIARLREILPPGALQPASLSQPQLRAIAQEEGWPVLTERQRSILPLLVRNLSNKEMARALSISHYTVRNHVSQLLRVLGAPDRRTAIAMLVARVEAEAIWDLS